MIVLDKNDPNYRQCSMSVMDNIADPNITFDEKGICNYYYEYLEAEKAMVLKGEEGEKKYNELIAKIKYDSRGRKYDCILGVSGGVDSTYLAYLAKKAGLRVLCVHFDNGWNSELAVKNIQNIVEKCSFDLYTYVIDWEEFKDLQIAYFKAGVIDIEAVNDLAIFLSLEKICIKFDIKYIIDGRNVVTENTLPLSWINKDYQNLLNIHKKFGTLKLKSFPSINRWQRNYIDFKNKYQKIMLLNYFDYNKHDAKITITEEFNWIDYGGKHYESVFTRFYQGYILPEKFKIDKRKAHLSNLIFSGQISKEEALSQLNEPIYNQNQFENDFKLVLKKLEFTKESFETYLNSPSVPHEYYGLSRPLSEDLKFLRILKPLKTLIFKIKH